MPLFDRASDVTIVAAFVQRGESGGSRAKDPRVGNRLGLRYV
jgi:hypothetical protein